MVDIRTGFGFDVHQLSEGREFWLGGVKIPGNIGALGHSDADVLLHAVCDALLGALNLRDIGFHFPDTSDEFKGIDSKVLLRKVHQLISSKGYKIGNIDSTICLERPKINPFIAQMQEAIAACLACDSDRISIKATTNEKMGFIGRGEGVTAYATCLVFK